MDLNPIHPDLSFNLTVISRRSVLRIQQDLGAQDVVTFLHPGELELSKIAAILRHLTSP